MSSLGTGYDLSASQFSPDGRVFQVEYAIKAVENSSTAIGLRCKDGVVFGVEKLVQSKLHQSSANRRIFHIDRHIGMVVSGLLPDARKVLDFARGEAQAYRRKFDDGIPLKLLAERVALTMHGYTLYSHVRPFGCSVILSAYSEHTGPEMYMVDPSGVSWGYHGCAMGKAKQQAKTELEKVKLSSITCEQLVKEVAKIIYVVHDEVKDRDFLLELSWVCAASSGRHELVPQKVYDEAVQAGKSVLDDSDSDAEI